MFQFSNLLQKCAPILSPSCISNHWIGASMAGGSFHHIPNTNLLLLICTRAHFRGRVENYNVETIYYPLFPPLLHLPWEGSLHISPWWFLHNHSHSTIKSLVVQRSLCMRMHACLLIWCVQTLFPPLLFHSVGSKKCNQKFSTKLFTSFFFYCVIFSVFSYCSSFRDKAIVLLLFCVWSRRLFK